MFPKLELKQCLEIYVSRCIVYVYTSVPEMFSVSIFYSSGFALTEKYLFCALFITSHLKCYNNSILLSDPISKRTNNAPDKYQVRFGNLYAPYLRNRSWCRTRIYFPNFYLNGKHSVPELNERSYSLFSTLFVRWKTTQLNSRLKRHYFVFRVFKLPRKCSVASGNRFILSHFSFTALILLHFLNCKVCYMVEVW